MSNGTALSAGTRIGPYEIVALVGVGGMGEVYRARDPKLNRDVAIKVLLAAVANDAERLARFSREAQVLASLNHPNIAQIHGLEDSNGIRALVMELVEGPTLADRIAQGPIPLDEALPIAKQIAEALEAAHGQGIIHRDLKPANIKVRADGTVKVLDFGLAKALDPVGVSSAAAADSPTLSMQATAAGVILGTAAYMAPEQARGKAVDARADIWAFGCVLFETLTGRRAFQGDDVTDTIVAVVSKEPDWTLLPAPASPVRPLLVRCLKKERKQRLQAIGDARILIEELTSGTSDDALVTAPVATAFPAGPAVAALVGVAALAALSTWALIRPAPTAPLLPSRFSVVLPAAASLANSFIARDLAISADGTHLVYSGGVQAQLMVRALDQHDVRPVAGITNARTPFLSPDANWIGFFDQRGDLKKVSMTGGAPVAVCRVIGTSRGASWGSDNVIVFATSDPTSGLLRVAADGGDATSLTTIDSAGGELDHYYPSVLPEGRGVLFTAATRTNTSNVAVLDTKNGERKTLIRGGYQAEYVESGHLIYVVATTLWAVRFDLEKLETIGDPVPVLDEIEHTPISGLGDNARNVSVSRHGTLIYAPQRTVLPRSLVWINRQGQEQPIAASPSFFQQPRLSPDGTRAAVVILEKGNADIYTVDLARGTTVRLTFSSATYPVWTPDGKAIIHSSLRDGVQNIYRRAADGTGGEERLTTNSYSQRPTAISSDGLRVVLQENSPDTSWDVRQLTLADRQTISLVRTGFEERNPVLSFDGRWLAYESSESGQTEVYVRPFPQVDDALYQISTNGGGSPAWAPNGRELFFVNGQSLMSVAVQTTSPFAHGTPAKVFDGPTIVFDNRTLAAGGGAYRMYDVAPDGQRFLMVKTSVEEQGGAPSSIVVVLNWFEELKAKVSSR